MVKQTKRRPLRLKVRKGASTLFSYDVKGSLNENQALFIEEFCAKHGLTVSAGIREVVNRYIETCKVNRSSMETA